MKNQKTASLLTAAAMLLSAGGTVLCALPAAPVYAETSEGGLVYNNRNGRVAITGFTDDLPAEVVIPAEIEGTAVTEIKSSAFRDCTVMTSVSIPQGVTDIGYEAFCGCTALESITIPAGVKYIWQNAFLGCTALTSASIPDGLENLGDAAFSGCTALAEVTAPDQISAIGSAVFADTAWLAAKQEEDPLVCLSNTILDGTACVGDVTIPDGVTAIGDSAFRGNEELTSVTLPASVRSINSRAFLGCTALESVAIAAETESMIIKIDSFSGCTALTSMTFPKGVHTISNGALAECTSLKSVSIYNPDCVCPSFLPDPAPEGLVIYGYADSTAQTLAAENNLTFEELGNAHVTGDLNGDRTLDVRDAVLFIRYTAEDASVLGLFSEFADFEEADFNNDGVLNLLDVCIMLNMIAEA